MSKKQEQKIKNTLKDRTKRQPNKKSILDTTARKRKETILTDTIQQSIDVNDIADVVREETIKRKKNKANKGTDSISNIKDVRTGNTTVFSKSYAVGKLTAKAKLINQNTVEVEFSHIKGKFTLTNNGQYITRKRVERFINKHLHNPQLTMMF